MKTSAWKWVFVIILALFVTVIMVQIVVPRVKENRQTSNQDTGRKSMVKAGDIDIEYRVIGKGHPLILIMGYGSTMNLWEEKMLASLAEHFQVIIFNNRGMGDSTAGEKAFSIPQFALDTLGVLDALQIEKAHVLGWSMGSYIAQELASTYPDRINKLVLYATTPSPEMFPPDPKITKLLGDTSGTPEEQGARWISVLFPEEWLATHGERIKEIFYKSMGNMNPESIGKQYMAIDQWKGLGERLSKLTHPTLLLVGKEDVLAIPANSIYLKEKLLHAELSVIEGAGHGLMFQDPDQFLQVVTVFLKK